MTQSLRPNVSKAAYGKRLYVEPKGIEQAHGDLCKHPMFTLCDLIEITLLTLYQRNEYDMWK